MVWERQVVELWTNIEGRQQEFELRAHAIEDEVRDCVSLMCHKHDGRNRFERLIVAMHRKEW